ncbi:MAG TPA: hypothetical protein VHI31_06940 [Actinomycetota bacterium]|nr:hypothetical protein [Actinomycetota bacterium]
MRIFLGGSKGLVLYEDEELTQLSSEPLVSAVRPNSGRLVAGTESGSILVYEGNGDVRVAAKDLGRGVEGLAVGADGTIFAGLIPAAMWASSDQGDTWEEVDAFTKIPNAGTWDAPWGTPLVSAIATHPKDPGTAFAGVEVGGIYRSRDAGKSWTDLNAPVSDIHSIQICPAKPERVYVTTGEGGFVSDDDGFGWRPMGTSNKRQYTMGLAAHPSEADRVIVSAAQGPPPTWEGAEGALCDIYLSTDSGRRFRTVVRGLEGGVRRKALVINSKVPSEIVFGTSTGQLFYSNDGGETFDEEATDLGDLRTIVFA